MDIAAKLGLIKQVGEEILTDDELKTLLETKEHPIAYDGFEPSGNIHIAQGIMRAININKMLKAGIKFKMYVADWHGWANNKLNGDLKKIQTCGDYLIEVWKTCGMDVDKVVFIRASDVVNSMEYWKKVMQVARNTTVKRITRCGQIMGRSDSEVQQASQILYPCMQCADIFELKADITQLGMDQRKVNVLAREIGPSIGFWKPIVVSHHMLMGLEKPVSNKISAERSIDIKMSKSKPDTAIFMTDSEEEIKRKINKAYCPEKIIDENPLMEYARYIIFEKFNSIKIERQKKFGGDLELNSYEELAEAFEKGDLHPMDLKSTIADCINKLVEPVRKHFEKDKKAKELLEKVKSFKITR
ncbi:tyrosine--tRNA ligase [Candidatus Pacearchaeota archaeon CG1_02_31_27]|nr:MAG: tyrosine--tRNA ligase [Candidatus Pacearchaeota archaeon CG1_02_31_27]